MAPSATQSLGRRAEHSALSYLQGRGLQCLRRNFNCRLGEIDLIMQDEQCLVFVEVRYRACNRVSDAALTVDLRKQTKIIRAARMFLRITPKYSRYVMRFDVVSLDRTPDGQIHLRWIKDAFRPLSW